MWKYVFTCAVGACGLAYSVEYKVERRETIHHVFTKDSGLDVDNVNGFVSVIGDSESTIRVDGEKIVRAADDAEAERGKREVTLDINEKDGIAQLYVNGPFRDNGHASENHGFHERGDRHYEVIYNLTIHAPRATALSLRTVNGAVTAENTSGKFDVHAVNGAVTLTGVAGAGIVSAVNGAIQAAFRENPKSDSSFKTVNGRIAVALQPALAADLKVKTMNGHVYTDFDLTPLAAGAGAGERKDGRFVFKSGGSQSFRAGAGGPELSFETVNGEIRIQKQTR